ncbi:hypothetical protein E2C01_026760 [Portunus trituberculatus]|uniref:Uncharacterized protein n=1 Tax=Portunus trituberculatus TaxID=210409 RepID=A0A5B7EGD3_PORTR|nr:hypothetical protein [Portunus trituberculatus]
MVMNLKTVQPHTVSPARRNPATPSSPGPSCRLLPPHHLLSISTYCLFQQHHKNDKDMPDFTFKS